MNAEVTPATVAPRAATPALRRGEIAAIVALVVVDQATKALVLRQLPLHDSVPVIPGLLNFTYVQNTGAAFGMLNAVEFPGKTLVLTTLAVMALVAIGVYAMRFAGETRLARLGITLIFSGAIGNLIDRARHGFVVDFVDVYVGGWHFWAFNVADAAITVGAIALLLDVVVGTRDAS
jgi:signal peptidase II